MMGSAWANLAPMKPLAGADANGEVWNLIPNKVFLKAGDNSANLSTAGRFVTSVVHLQSFMANPGKHTFTIIDLREASLYNYAHIRSALSFPLNDPDTRSRSPSPASSWPSFTIFSGPVSVSQAKHLIHPSVDSGSLPDVFQEALGKDYVIFHCQQSTHRGPTIASAWANYLKANGDKRTKVVLLNGGWSAVEKWDTGREHIEERVQLEGSSVSSSALSTVSLQYTTSGETKRQYSDNGFPSVNQISPIRRSESAGTVITLGRNQASLADEPRTPPADLSHPRTFLRHQVEEPVHAEPGPVRIKLRFARRLVTTPYA